MNSMAEVVFGVLGGAGLVAFAGAIVVLLGDLRPDPGPWRMGGESNPGSDSSGEGRSPDGATEGSPEPDQRTEAQVEARRVQRQREVAAEKQARLKTKWSRNLRLPHEVRRRSRGPETGPPGGSAD